MSSAEVFRAVRADAGRTAALVGYLPVGFPDVDASIAAMVELVRSGVDLIEVGMPYSDPGIDGPVIQAATQRALAGGVHTRDLFRAVEAIRDAGGRAVVMSYYNPLLRYGLGAFARDLAAAGGDGAITPDLIPDEADEWVAAADAHGLDKIFLVAPSSTPERIAYTVEAASGFVYAASTMGVTGARDQVDAHARGLVEATRAAGAANVAVGLGVKNAAQAREIAQYADGVIVGTALVQALGDGGLAGVGAVAREIAVGTRAAS